MRRFFSRLDLQAKVFLILIAVILPTFGVVNWIEYRMLNPILREEIRKTAISNAKTFAAEIVAQRMLTGNASDKVETYLRQLLYSQPLILRMEVFVPASPTTLKHGVLLASTLEEEPGLPVTMVELGEEVRDEMKTDEGGKDFVEVSVPIEALNRDIKAPKKILGMIRLAVSLQLVKQLTAAIWRTTSLAAIGSVLVLIFLLRFFLRRAIQSTRMLRKVETKNLELTEQLHEAQRQIMNTEKLAVMGQLTASFAHEIGTPLNALGGHLHLLEKEPETLTSRVQIIQAQVSRIETIVKNFLQSTAKPSSQSQLIDLNRAIEQTLAIVRPRTDNLGVDVKRDLDMTLGPVRVVPIEVEQILLNLVTNSVDSLEAKKSDAKRIEVSSFTKREGGKEWAVVSVYDTGEGIAKVDIDKVRQPFFTTKAPGQGTGLGLTISEQLAKKYNGTIEIESKKGAWTRVSLQLPYSTE